MLKYYVYAYLRNKDSLVAKAGTPYYIGKGVGNRAYQHCKNDSIHPPANSQQIIILEKHLTNLGALALERRMIKWYGRIDNQSGILRNKTDGGEGTAGYKQSYTHLIKKSIALTKPKYTTIFVCKSCNKSFIKEFVVGKTYKKLHYDYCSQSCLCKLTKPCPNCHEEIRPVNFLKHYNKCINTFVNH